jgi:hypothetical protein
MFNRIRFSNVQQAVLAKASQGYWNTVNAYLKNVSEHDKALNGALLVYAIDGGLTHQIAIIFSYGADVSGAKKAVLAKASLGYWNTVKAYLKHDSNNAVLNEGLLGYAIRDGLTDMIGWLTKKLAASSSTQVQVNTVHAAKLKQDFFSDDDYVFVAQAQPTPVGMLRKEQFVAIVNSYRDVLSFLMLPPEMRLLQALLVVNAQSEWIDRSAISNALASATGMFGAKQHRCEVFDDPNTYENDKTGATEVIRNLSREFKFSPVCAVPSAPVAIAQVVKA